MNDSGERALWRAVVDRAFLDAALVPAEGRRGNEDRRHRDTARQWLSGNSQDFRIICDAADIDPDYVRRKAAAVMA